jgi:hypothetical protein
MIQQNPVTAEAAFTLQSTIEFIDSLEKTVNAMRIYTRRLDQYPFDTVAGELISKCFALSRSAILLTQSGYPDEGFGLCRSLYESSIYLRYITQDIEQRDERARKFLEFGVLQRPSGSICWLKVTCPMRNVRMSRDTKPKIEYPTMQPESLVRGRKEKGS